MKNNNDKELLPERMADIKSGKIFEVPPGYFEDLHSRLFDIEGHFKDPSEKRFQKLRSIRPWLVAASVALLTTVSWWLITDLNHLNDDMVRDSQLESYIHSEIMEYDLETLAQNIDVDQYPMYGEASDDYEKYIEENLDDFDDIIVTH